MSFLSHLAMQGKEKRKNEKRKEKEKEKEEEKRNGEIGG
jgi:hypothetical protein